MSNLADLIENFILGKLAGERERVIVLRRNELADELACAPSQISYVLSTRFTIERGFVVESRRGLGGFVRIARIPIQNMIYEDAARKMSRYTKVSDIAEMLQQLQQHGMLSQREAALIQWVLEFTKERLHPQERADMIKGIFLTLADQS